MTQITNVMVSVKDEVLLFLIDGEWKCPSHMVADDHAIDDAKREQGKMGQELLGVPAFLGFSGEATLLLWRFWRQTGPATECRWETLSHLGLN